VDEAQDYYPMQYEIFNLLFKSARYTVLGDLNQSIEKQGDVSLYDEIVKIFNKNKSVKLFLNKSYRSSLEINRFTQKLLGKNIDFASFDRHETEPAVFSRDSEDAIDESIIKDVNRFCGQGYESIAIICKSRSEAEHVYERLKNHIKVRLVSFEDSIIEKGVSVIPAYLVKGLEFDAVFVYNGSDENYFSRFDRNLLYIACTRALHRLAVYYTGPKSRFL
jgi:Superfamily I DNA and RNA helicases